MIKRCWDVDPTKRPTANELENALIKWYGEIDNKENTEFAQQLQIAEEHNESLPDNIKFPDYQKKIHQGAVYTSRLLPTKEITRLLQDSKQFDLEIPDNLGDNADLSYNNTKTDQELITQTKRQLSLESQAKNAQEKTKLSRVIENQAYQTEPMVIGNNRQNIHPSFTPQLTQAWTNHHFTPAQAQEWINTNPPSQQNQASQEPAFYAWLRDTKNLTPEQVLNHSDLNTLKQEYQATLQQAHILHKSN